MYVPLLMPCNDKAPIFVYRIAPLVCVPWIDLAEMVYVRFDDLIILNFKVHIKLYKTDLRNLSTIDESLLIVSLTFTLTFTGDGAVFSFGELTSSLLLGVCY